MDFGSFYSPNHNEKLIRNNDKLDCDGESYEIVKNIPRFVDGDNYSAAFGLQWNTFKKTQFDSYTGKPITEERLEKALGQELTTLRGKKVLEAGSGAGRFTEILLKYGAVVYSFDFSSAVEANYQNNMPNDRLTLFQADIQKIPFSSDFFDIVVCLGVLQHTPNTKRSLAELIRVLKPNGILTCDHYKYHRGMFTSLYPIWWIMIKQFNPALQMKITDSLTRIFFPLHWQFKDNRLVQMLLRRVSPINFYYGRYPVPKEIQFEWSRLDTHDRNTDHFKRHVTKKDFEQLFEELGCSSYEIRVGGTGYVCRAVL
jgi:ubiquinone/menaquinone biosynthesis C-methylase UbiE